MKRSASFLVSYGNPVANAKGCIFSSDELSIALLTLILLHGTDRLSIGMLNPSRSVPA